MSVTEFQTDVVPYQHIHFTLYSNVPSSQRERPTINSCRWHSHHVCDPACPATLISGRICTPTSVLRCTTMFHATCERMTEDLTTLASTITLQSVTKFDVDLPQDLFA